MSLSKPFEVEVIAVGSRNTEKLAVAANEMASRLESDFESMKISVRASEFEGSIPDLSSRLVQLSKERSLILTVGGTGIGPEDFVPEATVAACDRLLPGIPQLMRAKCAERTEKAWISRYQCGLIGYCLVVNLPGTPRAALETYYAAKDLLIHIVKMLDQCS